MSLLLIYLILTNYHGNAHQIDIILISLWNDKGCGAISSDAWSLLYRLNMKRYPKYKSKYIKN